MDGCAGMVCGVPGQGGVSIRVLNRGAEEFAAANACGAELCAFFRLLRLPLIQTFRGREVEPAEQVKRDQQEERRRAVKPSIQSEIERSQNSGVQGQPLPDSLHCPFPQRGGTARESRRYPPQKANPDNGAHITIDKCGFQSVKHETSSEFVAKAGHSRLETRAIEPAGHKPCGSQIAEAAKKRQKSVLQA